MNKKNPFILSNYRAKVIKFKKPNNYSYLNFKYELKELIESLEENKNNEHKLLLILYNAVNKYRDSNIRIFTSCLNAFDTIRNSSNINNREDEITSIINEVIKTIEQELEDLDASKKNTKDENQKGEKDRF